MPLAWLFKFHHLKQEDSSIKIHSDFITVHYSPMENHVQRQVICPENEDLASFMWKKRQEMVEAYNGKPERIESTLYKSYRNVCDLKTPIKTLKEFSEIKGVGKWTVKLMKEFFDTNLGTSEQQELVQNGKKTKGTRRYIPQKNSAAYALLISLFRGTASGSEFMRKQELIDAAEASGLSRVPIAPESGKGKGGQFGTSGREWYSGWNCMKVLITKGLVAKSSNPAKYMLTQGGLEVARECLSRSGIVDSNESLPVSQNDSSQDVLNESNLELAHTNMNDKDVTFLSSDSSDEENSVDVPMEFLKQFTDIGYSKEDIHAAFTKVSQASNKETSSLKSAILYYLRNQQNVEADALLSEVRQTIRRSSLATSSACLIEDPSPEYPGAVGTSQKSRITQACSSSKTVKSDGNMNVLMMPPLKYGERFEDIYDVILILDDREQFTKSNKGYRSRQIIDNIRDQFKIGIEVRRLAVGDAIWIARHKHCQNEFVLDFIVERKEVEDLRFSIKENRYKDQKLRLLRCGLRKLIYLVEGDPNFSEAAEAIKTACFTTEILEGFDVQRTSGLGDTLRKYGHFTHSITNYYKKEACSNRIEHRRICPSFDEFTKKCQDLEKMTVSDVFATQLMQVPQVIEETALAVLELYPTLVSLARAYSTLEGDVIGQEGMLTRQSNGLISAPASRNIFQLVWGDS